MNKQKRQERIAQIQALDPKLKMALLDQILNDSPEAACSSLDRLMKRKRPPELSDQLVAEVKRFCSDNRSGGRIRAIRMLREKLGISLKEAHDQVSAIEYRSGI